MDKLQTKINYSPNMKHPSEISITMVESTMVVPAKETPRQTIWLTDVDLTKLPTLTHMPLVYIYPNSDNNRVSEFDSTVLKSSLSELLVTFYPVAGRLRENDKTGRIEIDCNAKGVLFVEVETSYSVSDFGDFVPDDRLKNLVIPSCDYSGGLTEIPLFMAQLTRFRCGGATLGLAVHHYLGDGAAYVYMTNQWARLARGLELDVLPDFDRTRLLVPRDPPQVEFEHLEHRPCPLSDVNHLSSNSQQTDTKVGVFKFSEDQITALKEQAMPTSQDKKYSTFHVMAAHVWRCALKARDVQNDTLVKFSTTVNGRSKFNQGDVPEGYFGNFIFNSVYFDKCGEILSRPLWYAASKVQETVTKVDDEYMKSTIDFLSLQPDLTALATGPHTARCPDIHVNYWKGIPSYKTDFGWGKPGIVRHGGIGYEGYTFIMPSEDGECLFVAINLVTSHLERFEKIIYDFEDGQ